WRFLEPEPGGDEIARLLWCPVVADDRVARGEQATGQAASHRAETDEPQCCHHRLRPLRAFGARLRRAGRAVPFTSGAISPLASRVSRLRRVVRAAARTSSTTAMALISSLQRACVARRETSTVV